ncbi:MAG: YggT family protein [Alphaproteobacteria bacterium]|nr:YggT family protein [Alphaproteobacteria bacterium]
MDIIIKPLFDFISALISLYGYGVIIYIVMNFLENWNVINPYNQFVYRLHNFLFAIIEPALEGVRRFVPPISGFDISPYILLLLLHMLESVIYRLVLKIV